MKKILIIMLVLAMVFGIAGCTQGSNVSETGKQTDVQTDGTGTEAETETETKDGAESSESGNDNEGGIIEDIGGLYYDSISGSITATVEILEEGRCGISIVCTSSEGEETTYYMTGTVDSEGKMPYEDCVKKSGDGTEEYKDGKGTVEFVNGSILWKDEKENDGEVLLFKNDLLKSDTYSGNYEDSEGKFTVEVRRENNKVRNYKVYIVYNYSEEEVRTWSFSDILDANGRLEYKECVKDIYKYSSDGKETMTNDYTDGTGYIVIENGTLTWHDDKEDAGSGFVFEMK